MEEDKIAELKSLEILLTELPKQLSDKIRLQFYIEVFINTLNDLCKNNYNNLKKLDIETRIKFIESIVDRIRSIQEILEKNGNVLKNN